MAAQLEFAEQRIVLRKRELRLMFALSASFHLAMVGLLVTSGFEFSRDSVAQLPGFITVDLVAAPAAAAPAPAPPKPVAPKPVVKQTVLPKEATLDPEKPKPLAKEKPKREPERAPEPKPVVQEEYADVMAQLRAEAGESTPEPIVTAKAKSAVDPQGSAVRGLPVAPEIAAWIRRTKIHIKRNWVLSPGFRTQNLETHVLVNIDRQGGVRGEPKITRPSGNPYYDEGVVRAILKSSPLPAPPEADRWPFIFVPEDSF